MALWPAEHGKATAGAGWLELDVGGTRWEVSGVGDLSTVHQWLPGEDDADGWAPRVGERREGKMAAARCWAAAWLGRPMRERGKGEGGKRGGGPGLVGLSPFGREYTGMLHIF